MTLWFRKYFWTVNLVAIALVAMFLALAVGSIVTSYLPPVQAARPAAAPRRTVVVPTRSNKDIGQILSRNIFCSDCKAEESVPEIPSDPSSLAPAQPSGPVKTALGLRLIVTLVSTEDQAWSFAAIEDTATETTNMYGIGKTISTSDTKAVVTDITERRVMLHNGNRDEYLDLEVAAAGLADSDSEDAPKRPKTVHTKSRATLPGMEDVSKGIRKISERKYEIQRSALNKLLSNTTLLARSARIVPSVRNGKPNGFKLYAIRPGSVYALLGMTNGDTINAVNGHPITTPDKALEIYTKLRTASHLSIDYKRRGMSLTNEYTIR